MLGQDRLMEQLLRDMASGNRLPDGGGIAPLPQIGGAPFPVTPLPQIGGAPFPVTPLPQIGGAPLPVTPLPQIGGMQDLEFDNLAGQLGSLDELKDNQPGLYGYFNALVRRHNNSKDKFTLFGDAISEEDLF